MIRVLNGNMSDHVPCQCERCLGYDARNRALDFWITLFFLCVAVVILGLIAYSAVMVYRNAEGYFTLV